MKSTFPARTKALTTSPITDPERLRVGIMPFMSGTYMFIDGNYLEERYRTKMTAFFGNDGELDYESLRFSSVQHLERVFYYNSIDYEPRSGETAEQHAERVEQAVARFAAIEAVRDVHVRPGSVRTGTRKEKRTQKKVDILVAVDMLTHAQNHNMEKAILVAGDLDFAPLVAAVVRLGVRVGVLYDKASYAAELLEESDFGQPLRLKDYFNWSSPFYRWGHDLPSEYEVQGDDFRDSRDDRIEFGGGTLNGCHVAMMKLTKDGQFAICIRDEIRRMNTVIAHKNQDHLYKYVAIEHPGISWDGGSPPTLKT